MKTEKLKQEFLNILGSSYSQYGYPEYCGWVEGLLHLESKEWTQRGIAQRLSEIFPASTHPTSVPSVNRALKTLESYGVIAKAGSRKTGYKYRLRPSSGLISSMLQHIMMVNQEFINKLEVLSARISKKDRDFQKAIANQVDISQTWAKSVESLLETTTKNSEGESK
ncbi:MAG: hypothetical protein ACTSQZ_01780 [Candidatus Thorarchaeota archaeon]